jgi:hypothetical protein
MRECAELTTDEGEISEEIAGGDRLERGEDWRIRGVDREVNR